MVGRKVAIFTAVELKVKKKKPSDVQKTFIENVNSLHNNFIVDNARRSEVIQAIVGYLVSVSREWDMLELKNIPEDSSNLQVLRDVLRRNGILFAEKEGLNSPYLKIGSDWESFFKNRSGKSRKTLRNIQNRFSRHANYSIQNITDLADYEKMKPQLYDISSNSWTEEIGDSLNSPANRSFFDRLSRVAAAQGWLIIWLLQFNDEPIAFEYHLKYNGKVNGLRASYKKTHSNMSPGVFLDSYIIKHLFGSKDIEEYDMGGDPDFYKRKWTNDCRQHATVNIFTRGAYSRLIHTYEHRLIPIIKHAVRRSR